MPRYAVSLLRRKDTRDSVAVHNTLYVGDHESEDEAVGAAVRTANESTPGYATEQWLAVEV